MSITNNISYIYYPFEMQI